MDETNPVAPVADDEVAYPTPTDWEYMTHEERYAFLRSEPKPDSAALQNALTHAKQDVLRDQGDERRAFQEARQEQALADLPHFTLALSGAAHLSLSRANYPLV